MISVRFQGKLSSFNVIKVYAHISNAEVAEAERFYEDRQDLLFFISLFILPLYWLYFIYFFYFFSFIFISWRLITL